MQWSKLKITAALCLMVDMVPAASVLPSSAALAGKAQEGMSRPEASPLQVADPPKTTSPKPAKNLDQYGDPLPVGALRRFGTIQFRHPEGISHSALSSNGKFLATTGENTVAVWDLASGKRLQIFRQCGISEGWNFGLLMGEQVALSPDGKLVVHSTGTGILARVWDTTTGREVCKVRARPDEVLHNSPDIVIRELVKVVRFTPDGKQLVILTQRMNRPANLVLCDPHTGRVLKRRRLEGQMLTFTPDAGKYAVLASSKPGQRGLVWVETVTGKEVARVPNLFPNSAEPVALSPDSHYLAVVAPWPQQVAVVDLTTGKRKVQFNHPDIRPRTFQHRFAPEWLTFTALAFAADGKTLFAGTKGGLIFRINLATGKAPPPFLAPLSWTRGLHPTPDGKLLISTAWPEGAIRRWDLTTGQEVPLPDGCVGRVQAACSVDGQWVAMCDLVGRVELWNSRRGTRVQVLRRDGPRSPLPALSPNGKVLAVGDSDGVIQLWDVTTGRALGRLPLPGKRDFSYFHSLAFSPDGRWLISAGENIGLRLWEVQTLQERWSVSLGQETSAVFSPDGKVLATGGHNGRVTLEHIGRLTLRDAATGKERLAATLEPHLVPPERDNANTHINCLAFSADGRLLATGHFNLIRLWDVATGQEVRALLGHKDHVTSLQFSPEGGWLVSTSQDHTIRVWEVSTGQEMRQHVQDGWVRCGSLDPAGRTVLTTCGSEVLLWSLQPAQLPQVRGHLDKLWTDLRSPDGPTAYRAIWALSNDPPAAVKLLRRRLPPVQERPDVKKIEQLIADLDADTFRKRSLAAKALADLGPVAAPYLRAAQTQPLSLEQQERIDQLLNGLKRPPSLDVVRLLRAIQVLERAGGADGRALLQSWSSGTPGWPLTEHAGAALKRLQEPAGSAR